MTRRLPGRVRLPILSLALVLLGPPPGALGAPGRGAEWDVAKAYGPRETVRFETSEGTWMNLDVHPRGDLLVFDLLGDLYTLPLAGGEAKRLTEGAAYDFQPRFSPDGLRLLFTSDRGGGFNLWVADLSDGELQEPRTLTEEKEQLVGGGAWDPSGRWVYGRKRITDISSIGLSELWAYHVDGGSGVQLVAKGGIAEVDSFSATRDGRFLYLGASPPFSYGRDPMAPVWSVRRYDRLKHRTEMVSAGFGSSAAPVLSPDEKTLAFVRRIGDRSTLWLHDLATGAEHQVWDGLDRDQIEAFATHGVYPSFDWTPDGRNLVLWAGGGFKKLDPWVTPAAVEEIPFRAEVEQQVHEALRYAQDLDTDEIEVKMVRWPVESPDGEMLAFSALGHLYRMPLAEAGPARPERLTDLDAFELSPAFSPDGSRLAFTTWEDDAGGALLEMDLSSGHISRLYASPAQLVNPAYAPDGGSLAFVQGSGAPGRGQLLGSEIRFDLYVLERTGGAAPAFVTSTSNRGPNRRITRPVFSPDGRRLYYFEDDPEGGGGERGERRPPKTSLSSVALDGTDPKLHLRFPYAQEAVPSPDLTHVAFTELHNAWVVPLPPGGEPVEVSTQGGSLPFRQLSFDGGEWVRWADGGKTLTWSFGPRFFRAALEKIPLADEPAKRPEGQGPEATALEVTAAGAYTLEGVERSFEELTSALEARLGEAEDVRFEITLDDESPWGAWKKLEGWLAEKEARFALAEAETAEGEEAEDAAKFEPESFVVDLRVPRARPEGLLALVGARLVTMRGDEVIEDGTVLVDGNRIRAVGPRAEVEVPAGARVVDAAGTTILPGFVDVHAHMGYATLDVTPQRDWQYYANLAYGVTTTHDPSASTHAVFSQAEMVAAGVMVGPRIFSTGFILYGALHTDMARIDSYQDALSHVRRLKALGAFSVKSYTQPRRDQRQWIVKAARAEEMMVVTEGAGDYELNMSMILDGNTGIEHALVVGEVYRDIAELFAASGTGYTPTLLVAYGGQPGENWFYQHDDVWRNEKLQSFHPPRLIDARARRRSLTPEEDFNHKAAAAGAAKIAAAGGLVNLGAHGQLQGLGVHWELWAFTHGGMDNHEALRVATLNGARYLGLDGFVGSLEPGKLADLAVLAKNPLEEIENTDSVLYTVANGVLYDAATMDRLWPEERPRGKFYFQDAVTQDEH